MSTKSTQKVQAWEPGQSLATPQQISQAQAQPSLADLANRVEESAKVLKALEAELEIANRAQQQIANRVNEAKGMLALAQRDLNNASARIANGLR